MVNPHKWRVSVISTDYDLHDLRSEVERFLDEVGFSVAAFETPDFPFYPGVDSHKACILELQRSDIVILVIDKSYGSLYRGKGPESITMKEFLEAKARGKIIIPCVRERTYQIAKDFLDSLKQLMEKKGFSQEQALKEIPEPRYVESWKVLEFIDRLRSAHEDDFMIRFDDSKDLIEKLRGRLRGLTRHICHRVIKEQVKSVKNIRTIGGVALSLGDVFEKGLFIEPPYKVLSGSVKPNTEASEICDLSKEKKRVMIVGSPGTGKSTLIVKAFLKHADICLKKKDYQIPFHFSLRGLGASYPFDFEKFIEDCCNRYLRMAKYPLFDKNNIRPIFYIDGFDEITEQLQDTDLKNLIKSEIFSFPFVICSRKHFAEERLQYSGLENNISIIAELVPWEKERTWRFIELFCNQRGNPKLFETMQGAYYDDISMAEIFENPLLLTMFLWIVEESDLSLPLEINDRVSLYDAFVGRWAKRELFRMKSDLKPELVLKAWQMSAWEIYKRRYFGEAMNVRQLIEILVKKNPELKEVANTPVFLQFLDMRPQTREIRGMFHEQIMEHLLAKELVISCKESTFPFPNFLKYEIRPQINRMIQALWSKETDISKDATLENLWNAYKNHLEDKSSSSIKVRNHAMYYIGKLAQTGYDKAKKKLEEADITEKDLFVKLSIAFGLMELEDYKREEKLLQELKASEMMDKANRGYHLVYYRDWILKDEDPPYLDVDKRKWGRTLRELIKHIQSKEKSHIALRRVELFTIKRFMEVRNCCGPITIDYVKTIRESIDQMEDKPMGFLKKIKESFTELEDTFNKLS